ncbi:MAG TPA: hypothetical protein VII11_06805 [Bacteroidota bacterium]
MDRYWDEIQSKICHKCIDGDGTGRCLLPSDVQCPVRLYLPEIVTTIVNVKSESYDAYIHSLRRNVCILCENQKADGSCDHRIHLECALDRYFPLIIHVVEDVKEQLKASYSPAPMV